MTEKFTKKLFKKKRTVGIWATLGAPCVAEIISNVGFDWILFDCEHGVNNPNNLTDQLNAVRSINQEIVCLVRVGSNDIVEIKRVLDIGVDGIMVPMISCRAEAEAVVRYCNYPPTGERGVTGISRASKYGLRENYLQEASNEISILVQVESMKGLQNLAAIIDTDGVDGVFIGPHDLAASMDKLGDTSAKEVEDQIKGAVKVISEKGKPAGTIALTNKEGLERFRQGFRFVAIAHDANFISVQLHLLKTNFYDDLENL